MAYPKGRLYPEKITFMVEHGTKKKIKELSNRDTMSEWLRTTIKKEITP